jgi:hypothetical protein
MQFYLEDALSEGVKPRGGMMALNGQRPRL